MPNSSPSITILVSCHKPVAWPLSDMYKPIHLGAAGAAGAIDGAQPDDEGDNISHRNTSFCELTAQYWGWKHVQSDYVGLCHYRRYFCFDGIDHWKNDHAQIEIPCLSPTSIAAYRLEDERLIRETVEKHDAIVPEHWTVEGVPTPLGPQGSIRDHMLAYGLMDESSLDRLLEICTERQPEYAPYVEAYLSGSEYQGYNCYIMRRELFDKLCSFEFDILLAFDAEFDYSDLTTTKKRIAGYFGEILVSAFFLKLEADGGYDIAQYPLTFFEDTPPRADFDANPKQGEADEIVWSHPATTPSQLSICLKSFFDAYGDSKPCKLTIVVPARFDKASALSLAGAVPTNIFLDWATWPAIANLPKRCANMKEEESLSVAPFLLAWLMPRAKSALWLEGPAVFDKAVYPSEIAGLHAAQDIHLQRELNKPYLHRTRLLSDERGRHVGILGAHALVLDLEALRKKHDQDALIRMYQRIQRDVRKTLRKCGVQVDERMCYDMTRASMLEKLQFSPLPFECVSLGLFADDTRAWANESTARDWADAQAPFIVVFGKDGMPDGNPALLHAGKFWACARESAAYETLLRDIKTCEMPLIAPTPEQRRLRDKLLPEGTRRRTAARSVATVVKKARKIGR